MTKETKKRNNRKLFGTSKTSLYIIRTWINLKNKTQRSNKQIYVNAGQLDYEPRFSIKFKNPKALKLNVFTIVLRHLKTKVREHLYVVLKHSRES